jgi:hypothetical protein
MYINVLITRISGKELIPSSNATCGVCDVLPNNSAAAAAAVTTVITS